MKKLIAYHNDPVVKSNILIQLQAHYDADEIIHGTYWKGGKGCAVGCTIHGSDHAEYERRLGIPAMLARLEDVIFEGLPNDKAKEWPLRFCKTIAVGSDLSRVGYQFMYWNLTENLVLKDTSNAEVQKAIIQCRKAIKQCAEVIYPLAKDGKFEDSAQAWAAAAAAAAEAAEAAEGARSAAQAEAWAARSAAEGAAWAAWAARSAAEGARSAAQAAEAARSVEAARSAEAAQAAARSAWAAAAWAARSAEAAEAARSAAQAAAWAAWAAAYEKMSDKLIEFIRDAA